MTADPRAVLLRDIFDDPDDDLPRLVLGDLLADEGDPRGEFIQIDVRLAAGVADDAERARLEARRREILANHALNWLGPLVDVASAWEFRRGFVRVTLRGRRTVPTSLHGSAYDWVESVRLIDFNAVEIRVNGLAAALTRFPHLDLSHAHLGDEGVGYLFTGLLPNALRHLDLSGNRLRSSRVVALAAWPGLRKLHELCMTKNRIGDEGAIGLARSAMLEDIRRLNLEGCAISHSAKAALRDRFGDRVRL